VGGKAGHSLLLPAPEELDDPEDIALLPEEPPELLLATLEVACPLLAPALDDPAPVPAPVEPLEEPEPEEVAGAPALLLAPLTLPETAQPTLPSRSRQPMRAGPRIARA
jgi:hypothetical protein